MAYNKDIKLVKLTHKNIKLANMDLTPPPYVCSNHDPWPYCYPQNCSNNHNDCNQELSLYVVTEQCGDLKFDGCCTRPITLLHFFNIKIPSPSGLKDIFKVRIRDLSS